MNSIVTDASLRKTVSEGGIIPLSARPTLSAQPLCQKRDDRADAGELPAPMCRQDRGRDRAGCPVRQDAHDFAGIDGPSAGDLRQACDPKPGLGSSEQYLRFVGDEAPEGR